MNNKPTHVSGLIISTFPPSSQMLCHNFIHLQHLAFSVSTMHKLMKCVTFKILFMTFLLLKSEIFEQDTPISNASSLDLSW